MRRLGGVTDSTHLSKLWEVIKDREARRAAVPGTAKSGKQLREWTTTWELLSSIYI